MDWVSAPEWWAQFVSICLVVYYAPAFRIFVVGVLILATIWAIAKVYSGELQNAEKGPVAIRRHKGAVGSIATSSASRWTAVMRAAR
jgi:hypothetical protein